MQVVIYDIFRVPSFECELTFPINRKSISQLGFIAVLKKLPMASVPPIELLGISRQQPPEYWGHP